MRKDKLPTPDEEKVPKRESFFSLMDRLNRQRVNDNGEKIKLEKKDWIALFLSAFYTLFLPSVGVLLLLGLLILLIFRYF